MISVCLLGVLSNFCLWSSKAWIEWGIYWGNRDDNLGHHMLNALLRFRMDTSGDIVTPTIKVKTRELNYVVNPPSTTISISEDIVMHRIMMCVLQKAMACMVIVCLHELVSGSGY